ncbi:MAG: hypothetical protein ACKO1X_05625 [Acidimicrobiales bacterium]
MLAKGLELLGIGAPEQM